MLFPRRLSVPPAKARLLARIPGVRLTGPGEILCTIDAWETVRRKLGIEDDAGQPKKLKHKISLRPYQAEGADWIVDRWEKCGAAYLAFGLRLGKTRTILAAVKALRVKNSRVLVMMPAMVLRTWIREIRKVLDLDCVVCDGRSASVLRHFDGDPKRRHGRRIDRSKSPEEFDRLLNEARLVLCPYDRLIAQSARTARGVEFDRSDLPGWASTLGKIKWTVAIADEGQKLRTFSYEPGHRRNRALIAAQRARRRIILSGTPSFGLFRHLWGQLDWLLPGQYGVDKRNGDSAPYQWDEYFCNGRKVLIPEVGREVWKFDDVGPRIESEWADHRRDAIMLVKHACDVAKDLPPIMRDVRRVGDGQVKPPSKRSRNRKDAALIQAFDIKAPECLEQVVDELVNGLKVMVLTYRHRSADDFFAMASKMVGRKGEEGAALRAASTRVWNGRGSDGASGVSAEARSIMIEEFVDHDGAALFVATTHALADGGVSMNGLSSVHHLEYHDSPMGMVQAELRGYEPGISHGYAITHWHAEGTIDDEIEQRVMPKTKMVRSAFDDPMAGGMSDAFFSSLAKRAPKISIDDALAAFVAKGIEDEG